MPASSTILHKRNSTAGVMPSSNSLLVGELAVNTADGKIFTKTVDNNVKTFLNAELQPYTLNVALSSVAHQYGSNTVTGILNGVLGGVSNDVSGAGSTIVNGSDNSIQADYAFIGNGSNNTILANGDYGAIIGGQNNNLNHSESFILGSNITSHLSGFTYVNNLSVLGKIYGDGSELTGITGSGGGSGIDVEVRSLTATWVGGNSAYSTVQANSATTWNYQGTDIKALTANWQDTYTLVQSNSATWSSVVSFSTLIGNGTTNPLTATHNLNTKDIIFSVREVDTNKIIQAAGRAVDNNSLELTFNSVPTINQYDLTVLSNGGVASGGSGGTTNAFALVNVTSTSYIQLDTYTHNLYNDTTAGGQITVTLLPPANHIAVTRHKKIGSTANVVLSAPNGATIDGYPTYTLMNQYESIGIYSDGTNYFIE